MRLAGLFQLHENQRLLRFAQTVIGRVMLWLFASALLAWHEVSPLVVLSFSLVMVLPKYRHSLVSLAAVGMLAEKILDATGMGLPAHLAQLTALVLAGLAGLYASYLLIKHFANWPSVVRQFPVLTLHLGIWMALALSTVPMFGALGMVAFLAWRLSYMVTLASRGKMANTRFRDHLFYLVPVYGGEQTPFGKGLDYLSRNEATGTAAIARSQLAGIKLLILAALWLLVMDLMNVWLYGQAPEYLAFWPGAWTLGLMNLAGHLHSGVNPDWYQSWALVYLELIYATLRLAVIGHLIVGSLRLLGFNVFRNTYKPLLAESILDFWNRFYYYFKELLVDFFFYPSYLRLRALSPRLRLFCAVFAAAFIGNMYHHILANPDAVLQADLAAFWITWGPRFFYCFLLAAGIWVSMLRQQKLRSAGGTAVLAVKIRRIAGVWTFYGIIHIWNLSPGSTGFGNRFAFLLSLLGI